MSSPTRRSLELLRTEGFECQVVERFNSFARRRIDLFGVIDVVAIRSDRPGVLGVQATTATHRTDHQAKIAAEPRVAVWLAAGNALELHVWSKRGPRGKRKTWQVVREAVVNKIVQTPLDNGKNGVYS